MLAAASPKFWKYLDLQKCKNDKLTKIEHFDDSNFLYLTNLYFLTVGGVVIKSRHNEIIWYIQGKYNSETIKR